MVVDNWKVGVNDQQTWWFKQENMDVHRPKLVFTIKTGVSATNCFSLYTQSCMIQSFSPNQLQFCSGFNNFDPILHRQLRKHLRTSGTAYLNSQEKYLEQCKNTGLKVVILVPTLDYDWTLAQRNPSYSWFMMSSPNTYFKAVLFVICTSKVVLASNRLDPVRPLPSILTHATRQTLLLTTPVNAH
jgi:hypothetical protein